MGHLAINATLEHAVPANGSAPNPWVSGPDNRPIKHPMVVVYIIIVAVTILFTLLVWRGIHVRLVAARGERLSIRNPGDTHKTCSVWLKLVKNVFAAIKALFTTFLLIFTKSFWKRLWGGMKHTFSPMSSCGICLNTYCCGRVCNPTTDGNVTLSATQKGNVVVTQSPIPTSKPSHPQRPANAVVVEEMV